VSVSTRIVLATLCVFNAFTLAALGVGALFVVNGAAGPTVAVCFWLTSIALFGLARRLRKGTEWN
jgi:hypothetical protein